MNCEVVAVGTELLLGQIVDTNSSWIGQELAAAGIDSLHQTKVGDNAARIRGALELALSRSDAVVVCGGLGPTQDDITRDVIADVMGVELVHDEAIADRIRQMFAGRGREMPANNLRQAQVPAGARTMAQQPGTAPGLVCPIGEAGDDGFSAKVIYAVPGVPYEMREMVLGTVVPDLRARAGDTSVIASRVLRTWGQSESGLAETLADRIDELDRLGHAGELVPTLAFLASGVEGLKVRITAKAPDAAAVQTMLAAEEQLVRELLGDIVFGVDDQNMETVVLGRLAARNWTMAVAEAATGGYLAGRLTAIEGSASAFAGGVVVGPGSGGAALLGVDHATHDDETAAATADAVRGAFDTHVGLAVVGPVEGDGGVHRPGTVLGAIALSGADTEVVPMRLPGDRERIRQYACIGLLDVLRRRID